MIHGPQPIVTNGLVLALDAANPRSYVSGSSTWYDTVGGMPFSLFNSPAYSSNNGGYLSFVPASSQYASSSVSLPSMSTFTIEVWHYYNGTYTGLAPCIITEVFPGNNSRINFFLGTLNSNNPPNLQSGYYDGSFKVTPGSYYLTSNNWYQLVSTYDGATNKLYVNNSIAQSTAAVGTPVSSQGGIRLMRRWDLTDYWGGNLATVKIYNRALSSQEIQQNYNAQKTRFNLI